LVVTDRLVKTSISILRLLLNKKLHYNEIQRQTGTTDRTHVNDTIEFLEKGELIMEFKISKHDRKQQGMRSDVKIIQLTDLGLTFIELMVSVEKYNESYNKLKRAVRQNFDIPQNTQKNILVNKLLSRGWKKEEVPKYKVFYERACFVLSHLSPRQNIDALLTRYVSLLSQPDMIENENAMIILNKIITDLLFVQISFIREDIEDKNKANLQLDNEDEQEQRHLFDYVVEEKFGILGYIFKEEKSLKIRFTNEEAKQVLLAILNIFRPSKKAMHHPYYDSAIGDLVKTYFGSLTDSKTT
jgi:DNA-binding HxlR family transcriptional regulator